MNTNKAAYWIALGALALGLTSEYQHGNFASLHRLADRGGSIVCRISTQAQRTLAFARVLMSRDGASARNLVASLDEANTARVRSEMQRDQARIQATLVRDQIRDQARVRADVPRAQAEIRRAEIEQIRWSVQSQNGSAATRNRSVTIVCPKM
jgi:hypothetical protein